MKSEEEEKDYNNNNQMDESDSITTVPQIYVAPGEPNNLATPATSLLLSLMKQEPEQLKSPPPIPYNFLYIDTTPATTLCVPLPPRTTTKTPSVIKKKNSSIEIGPSSSYIDSGTNSLSSRSITTDESSNNHQYNYN